MDKAEFDKFADEYQSLHARNIRASGESPEFFAEYKVADTARLARCHGLARDARVLDFGSGIGNSIPYFRKYLPQARLTCLDVSERSLAISESRYPGQAERVAFDGGRLPFPDASFDLAFTACVFHHIPAGEHVRLLGELHRVLSHRGLLVLFEHNPWNPLTRRAVHDCPFDENAVLLSSRVACARVREAGFPAPRAHFRIFFPGALRSLRPLERMLTWLPMGAQYFVLASRTEGGGRNAAPRTA